MVTPAQIAEAVLLHDKALDGTPGGAVHKIVAMRQVLEAYEASKAPIAAGVVPNEPSAGQKAYNRLYAAMYGAFCRIDDGNPLKQVQAAVRRLYFMAEWGAVRSALDPTPAHPVAGAAVSEVLKARAEGRVEVLNILLNLDAETQLDDYVLPSSLGDSGDYTYHWNEAGLRELFSVDDATYDAFDKAEAAYWEYLSYKDEAQRAMAFAANMHNSGEVRAALTKHREFALIAHLCTTDHAPAVATARGVVLEEVAAWFESHPTILADEKECAAAVRALMASEAPIIPEAGAETGASRDVLAERQRQKDVEDWTPKHDDEHPCGEIAAFAAVYAMPPAARDWPASETSYGDTFATALCPEDWHPKFGDRRRELVKAGALILAEIERLDRAALKGGSSK